MWTPELRQRAALAAINVGNMCIGPVDSRVVSLLGEIAGWLHQVEEEDRDRYETREGLLTAARKLRELHPGIPDDRVQKWVGVIIDLAEAAAFGNIKDRDNFLMVLRGVEVALEQTPPVRGLGKGS